MKRHSSHLPSLNALYLQNVHYKKHKEHLQRSKSSYEYIKNSSVVHGDLSKPIVKVNTEESQLSSEKFKCSLVTSQESQLFPSPEKIHQRVLKPYQKRKISERNQQNIRMLLVLQSNNPSRYRYDQQSQKARQVLKDRISKYIKDGGAVRYKFKKSLVEIEHRRQLNKKKSLEQSKLLVPEEIKEKLATIQKRKPSQNTKNTKNKKQMSCSDIYTYSFLEPKTQMAPKHSQQLNFEKKKRKSTKIKTESYEVSSTTQQNPDSFVNKYLSLKQSIQLRIKGRSRPPTIIGNGQTLVIKSRGSKVSDMQIAMLPPISKRQ